MTAVEKAAKVSKKLSMAIIIAIMAIALVITIAALILSG